MYCTIQKSKFENEWALQGFVDSKSIKCFCLIPIMIEYDACYKHVTNFIYSNIINFVPGTRRATATNNQIDTNRFTAVITSCSET